MSLYMCDITGTQFETKDVWPEWINVKDKLPNHEQLVLGSAQDKIPLVVLCYKGSNYLFLYPDCMSKQVIGITHWIPLPESPKVKHE